MVVKWLSVHSVSFKPDVIKDVDPNTVTYWISE